MTPAYIDTSVLLRSYLRDEPGHAEWRGLLFSEERSLMSGRLLHLEFHSAIAAAQRAKRVRQTKGLVALFEQHCSAQGPIFLLAPTGKQFTMATELVRRHILFPPDALHIAAALTASDVVPDMVFLTCDERQAVAAKAEGLVVATKPDNPS